MEKDKTTHDAPRQGFVKRNFGNLLVLACVLLVGFAQWPMIKGMVYRMTGSAPQSNIAWRSDYQAALVEAKQTGKPILVDFTASWCPPCQTMKHDVWPDGEVETLANTRFIPLLIDVDIEQSTPNRFDVSTIPTIIALTPEGKVIRRAGFLSASEMVQFMNDSLEPQDAELSAAR